MHILSPLTLPAKGILNLASLRSGQKETVQLHLNPRSVCAECGKWDTNLIFPCVISEILHHTAVSDLKQYKQYCCQ